MLGPGLVRLGAVPSGELSSWATRVSEDVFGGDPLFDFFAGKLRRDLVLVGKDVMPTLTRECTEQTARVQLGKAKTVQNGPFYSEYLPAETILAASLTLRAAAHEGRLRALLHGKLVQLGGDEALGKGLVWARLAGAAR